MRNMKPTEENFGNLTTERIGIWQARRNWEKRNGKPLRIFSAYPLIGRGSVQHDLPTHEEVERRFDKSLRISPLSKICWLLGGYAWW